MGDGMRVLSGLGEFEVTAAVEIVSGSEMSVRVARLFRVS